MDHIKKSMEPRDSSEVIVVTPRLLSWQSLRDSVTQIECCTLHSALIDKLGNLYTFGKNDFGQLGLGTY